MTSVGGSTSMRFGLNLMSSGCGKLMTSSMSDGGQVTTMLAPAFSSRCQMLLLAVDRRAEAQRAGEHLALVVALLDECGRPS